MANSSLLSAGVWFVPAGDLHGEFSCRRIDNRRRRTASVDVLDHLGKVVLDGGHGGHDGQRAEAVRDEREVRQMALERWVEDGRGTHGAMR